MELIKLIYKLVQGLEKLGKKVRETLAKILAGVNCSGRLRNTNISNLIIGVTSIVALIVVIIAFSSPHLSNQSSPKSSVNFLQDEGIISIYSAIPHYQNNATYYTRSFWKK